MTPHELSAAYALDALDPEDLDGFREHLDECVSCRDEVASFREAAATLGATGALSGVGATGPAPGPAPASLRRAVLAGVAWTHQESAPQVRPPRTPRRLAWIGTAAAAIAALALGVGVGGFLASDDPALAAHEQAMRIISAPDAHTETLPLGRSSLVMSEDYAGAVLMGDTAPMPAKGTEYQIWMGHADGTAAPGPCFVPDADGTYMVLLSGDMGGVSKVFVTTEPPGGSEAPSGPMIAEADLGA